ncbi:hypothetical protein ACFQ9D_11955 [Arthrobacter koreensis]|uniref:hypothetical protein n=1 Tax=Arthrobacter koreensis TaxID=199136 RepID=UPI00363F6465
MANFIDRLASRMVKLERRVDGLATGPQLGYSTIEDGKIEERDAEGNLVSIIGKQYDGTHGAVVVSGPVPPRPSAPQAGGGPGLLNYAWDGIFANAVTGEPDKTVPAPMDFARVEVHASRVSGFSAVTADTLIGTIESPRGSSNSVVAEAGTWYLVLVARALSGKASMQSLETSAVVQAAPDVEGLLDEFNQEADRLQQELNANADELSAAQGRLDTLTTRTGTVESSLATVQAQVNSKNKIINSTANASGTTGYVAGDTWQKWSTLADGGKLVAAWRFTVNNTWLPVILDPTYLPLVDIGQGTFGELEGARLKIGSGTNLVPNGAGEWGKAGAWSSGLTWTTADKPAGLPGAFTSNGGTYSSPVNFWDVEPGTEYRFEVWVKASVAGSVLYIEMRDQNNVQAATWSAIPGETSAAAGSYPVSNYSMPTGWTKITAKGTTSATANKMRVGSVFFNHTNGTVRDATQYIAGMRVTRRMDAGLIVENTIRGYHVDAESVGAQVGGFVEADIGKLRVIGDSNLNTVTAERIAANIGTYLKLYASQLIIGEPGNMLPDPGFQDPEGWQIPANGYAILPTGGRNGNAALEIAATTTQVGRYYGAADRKRQFRVTGGATYQAKVWYKSDAAITAANRVAIYGKWTNPSTGVSGNFATPGNGQNPGAVAANTWAEIVYEFTVPADATQAFIGLYVQSVHNSRVVFSEPSVREKITPALIVDGFFQGLRVIGANIETTSSADRGIKLNDGGLNAWDSSGVNTFRLDAATGAVFAQGNFETSTSDVTARLGVLTFSNGIAPRPALTFVTTNGHEQNPKIFAEGVATQGSYSAGTMVLTGSEEITNSTGRSELELAAGGERLRLRTVYGPNSGTGFEAYGTTGEIRLFGKMPVGQTANQHIRLGGGAPGSIPAGGSREWTITHAAPPPSGVIWPQVTPDYALGANMIVFATNSITRTGFKVRMGNPGASAQSAGFKWMGVWGNE